MRVAGAILLGLLVAAIVAANAQEFDRRGPPGDFRPEEMFSRLDANGNGMLEPDEMQGRARYFIERIASDAKLDLSKPVPLSKLQEAMRQRMSGGFGGPPSSFPPANSSSSSASTSAPTSTAVAVASPVPGFGIPDTAPKVPGFGPVDPRDAIKTKYGAEIFERVEDCLRRADENKNNVLEESEWRNTRWSNDPREFDKNKDGKLTREEIAERYLARQRSGSPPFGGGPGGDFGRGPPFGGFGGPPPGSSGFGSPTVVVSTSSTSSNTSGGSERDRYLSYAESQLRQYDENKDGVLQKNEWSKMRGDPEGADKNRDGLLTKEELADRAMAFSKGSSSSSGSTVGGSRKDAAAGKKSYRFLSPSERLPKGLPSWFAQKDADGDGQVAMAEYATSWTDALAAEFAGFDRDGDGLITAKEAIDGGKKEK